MLRVFDCSNSEERPANRGYGGSIVNEFVAQLHKEASNHGVRFVSNVEQADLIFTNDVFPTDIRELTLPKVKRADGIFWQRHLQSRNLPTIAAIEHADQTIFISQYSKKSAETLYPTSRAHGCVITHWMPPYTKYPRHKKRTDTPTTFLSMATNWSRPEKRLSELIRFAALFPETTIYLVGTNTATLPNNIIGCGYLHTQSDQFLQIARNCDAFLNLTCKDAATKTVCVATNIGLPTLYAGSGGVGELVGEFGQSIVEKDNIEILEETPELLESNTIQGYKEFRSDYAQLHDKIASTNMLDIFNRTLAQYFQAIKSTPIQ